MRFLLQQSLVMEQLPFKAILQKVIHQAKMPLNGLTQLLELAIGSSMYKELLETRMTMAVLGIRLEAIVVYSPATLKLLQISHFKLTILVSRVKLMIYLSCLMITVSTLQRWRQESNLMQSVPQLFQNTMKNRQ